MTSPGAQAGTGGGQWWVISVPTSAHGSPQAEVSQKPFPVGSSVVSGPYPTKAAAQAALAGGAGGQTGLPVPDISIPNPFSWIGAVSHWIGDFVLSITDVHMWISLGWILLGGLLLFWGILLWLRGPIERRAGAIGGAVAAAA